MTRRRLVPEIGLRLDQISILLFPVGVGVVVWIRADSTVLGVLAAIGLASILAGVIMTQQPRNDDRIGSITRSTGPLLVASVDIASLPEGHRRAARDTLPRLERNSPSIPLRLGVIDGRLVGDKMCGRANGAKAMKLAAQLSGIASVEAGPGRRLPFGNSLTVGLDDGTRLRFEIQARRHAVDELTAILRRAIADAPQAEDEIDHLTIEFPRRS